MNMPPVKRIAEANGIKTFQPVTFKDASVERFLTQSKWDLFIVVAYNFILPRWLLDLPLKGCVNVHPSLLPALRGPSPIRTAILKDLPEAVGVGIMLLDEKMDHGPIINQAAVVTEEKWPVKGPELDDILANSGAYLLTETVPKWLAGTLTPNEQNHDAATYTSLFRKGENEIILDPNNLPTGEAALEALRKIYA